MAQTWVRRLSMAAVLFFLAFAATVFANDMILELDNKETVLLHIDHTWDFQSISAKELTENVSLMLDDGSTVRINKNHSWSFVERPTRTDREEVEVMGSAYSQGSAHHSDIVEARMVAMSQATTHLAKQILSAVNEEGLSLKKITACIEREDKDVDTKENLENKLWRVLVRLSVDSYQIQMILDCARDLKD